MRLAGRLQKLKEAIEAAPAHGEEVQALLRAYRKTGAEPKGESRSAALARQIIAATVQMNSTMPGGNGINDMIHPIMPGGEEASPHD